MQLGLPLAPWYDATCRGYKRHIRYNKIQPFAATALLCLLQKNDPTFLPFLLSHGLNTFEHIFYTHKKVSLTCWLDDPIYLHGISYSVASYGLYRFFLLTLQSHLVLVAGTEA